MGHYRWPTRQQARGLRGRPCGARLGKVGPQTRGRAFTSFGHRRGDCADVEVIRPPEPVDVPRLMEPLEKLNPRGGGP